MNDSFRYIRLLITFLLAEQSSEAENAIRKINDSNTLGMKADFAFDTKKKRIDLFEEIRQMEQQPTYDTNINWSERYFFFD